MHIRRTKGKVKKNKKYIVNIDTEIYKGSLRYGDFLLKGKSKKTILISTNLCHPSLANNELSGPLVWVSLYEKLSKLKNRYFSYRFVIIPETIGSIAFFSKKTPKKQIENIYAGITLTCLGGYKKKISFKHSRRHWLDEPSEIDRFVKKVYVLVIIKILNPEILHLQSEVMNDNIVHLELIFQ